MYKKNSLNNLMVAKSKRQLKTIIMLLILGPGNKLYWDWTK
jgi:hypothetical protein